MACMESNQTHTPIFRAIEKLRGERGWSRADLAAKLGARESSIINTWEKGATPGLRYLKLLAQVFEQPLDFFVTLANQSAEWLNEQSQAAGEPPEDTFGNGAQDIQRSVQELRDGLASARSDLERMSEGFRNDFRLQFGTFQGRIEQLSTALARIAQTLEDSQQSHS